MPVSWGFFVFFHHYHKLCRGSVTPQIITYVSGLESEIRLDETLSGTELSFTWWHTKRTTQWQKRKPRTRTRRKSTVLIQHWLAVLSPFKLWKTYKNTTQKALVCTMESALSCAIHPISPEHDNGHLCSFSEQCGERKRAYCTVTHLTNWQTRKKKLYVMSESCRVTAERRGSPWLMSRMEPAEEANQWFSWAQHNFVFPTSTLHNGSNVAEGMIVRYDLNDPLTPPLLSCCTLFLTATSIHACARPQTQMRPS